MIDLTTYALLRKQITTAASGVSDVRAEGDELVFVLADGREVRVAVPATGIRNAEVRDDALVLTLADGQELVYTPTTMVVDATLTQSGQAADAKATGDALSGKLTEPATGLAVGKYFRIAAIDENGHAVLEAVDAPVCGVQDVLVNGASIVADGMADIKASGYGIGYNEVGLYLSSATASQVSARKNSNVPITPTNYDYAVKAAMCDGKGAAWTSDEQAAARERMGIDKPYVLVEEITMEEEAKIIRENEPNGTKYNFKSFLIIGETPVLSEKKYIVILINTLWAVSFNLDPNSKRYFAAKIYVEGGRMFTQSTYGASSDAISAIQARNTHSFGRYAMNTINKFETSENTFPIGTKIKLYGVRA